MKKTFALLLTLITLLSLIPVSAAAASTLSAPQVAINAYEEFLQTTPKAQYSSEFKHYKGAFYIDFNQDDIPELVTAFDNGSDWDTCMNVYYCRFNADYSAAYVTAVTSGYTYDGVPYRDISAHIGGSGGSTVDIVRLKDGRYILELYEKVGGFEGTTSYELFNGSKFVDCQTPASVTHVWSTREAVPSMYKYYAKPDPNSPFVDVKSSDYFYEAVLWALENGVTKGTTATRFVPSTTCTRQQVVTFLYRANGSPAVTGTNPFKDVKKTDYSYNAILWAVANGITQGTTATTFNPTGTCSTAHVLTFLYRTKGSPAVEGAVEGSHYYDAAAQWAKEIGLYDALPFGFEPGRSAPRAEIVTYLFGTKDIAAPEKPVEEETPVEPAALPDGTYPVYFKADGITTENGCESILMDVIQYTGLSADEVNNLKKGQVIALSRQNPEAPDIVVKDWQIADRSIVINGIHEFWYNAQFNRYVYSNYELDPNGGGMPYVVKEDLRMTMAPDAAIEDWSSASLRTPSSLKAFFESFYSDTHIGHMEVKNGKITLAYLEYRP